MAKNSVKQIASNRKAFHDYFIEDKLEAGIELAGTEVKSIRQGSVNLNDSFCAVKDGEMKVGLALARGKKLDDKREAAAQRDAKREMDRVARGRY